MDAPAGAPVLVAACPEWTASLLPVPSPTSSTGAWPRVGVHCVLSWREKASSSLMSS